MIAQGQQLGFTLDQGLRLNQQMLHSLKLMELPVMELRERIEQELADNPALELVENDRDEPLESVDRSNDDEGDKDFFETAIAAPVGDDAEFSRNGGGTDDGDAKRQFLEGAVSRPESLQEHLLWQFRLQKVSTEVRAAGEVIIGNLNEDGFHLVPLYELLPETDRQVVNDALRVIHALDPQGCATEDYRESLMVQARLRFGRDGEDCGIIIAHLSELERGRFSGIAKLTGMTTLQIEYLFRRFKELSPFPGRHFTADRTTDGTRGVQFVVPDIEVYHSDDELVIKINDEEIPALQIHPFFLEARKYKRTNSEARAFIQNNVLQARWFIGALERRNTTLLRVTRAIVEKQKAFFEKGPSYICPLTQHEIALELEVDDSTISRTANSKHVQTEWGIYAIGHFFSNQISGDAAGFSKAGVMAMIKEIITKAEKRTSDIEISHILEKRGIKIARRTVAKYRSELEKL